MLCLNQVVDPVWTGMPLNNVFLTISLHNPYLCSNL